MTYPLVRDLADDGIPVTVTCRVLEVLHAGATTSGGRSPVTATATAMNAHLTNAAFDVHADDPRFGYRFIADELERQGHKVERASGLAAVLTSSGSGRVFAKKRGLSQEARASGPRRPRRAATSRAARIATSCG